ncbi:hypothetical protein PPACK8108_LOCUS19156 [Phakopsora pachyrhizi]|uniref:Zn(2)-C6 fungal-type domain-containing protein n=1 Tax=Phakopsora pachyrhizi TaxID=170000 RepID=A0AAV0BGS6_PHAPC|nr:hypothetical protein PPACK8108_LOCUS19156 [Phakopsora pachyrhizi]
MDVNNGFFEVHQYAKPCAFCTRNNLVCCEATRSGSKKCEACRVVKGVCVFSKTLVFSEGRKVWCNPTTKFYEFEHPINEVPTDDFESGIVSIGRDSHRGIPISSKGWVNHKGVESNQVGSSERSGRSQLRQAQEAKATQHSKRQKANPVTLTEATRATLNAVAIGSSSKEDGDDEDGGINWCGNTAETEDNKYRPLIEGIRELIRGNPTKRFMELAAVSDQMELEMTEMIKEMGSWLEHLELNGMVPYEAWNGSKGKGRDEGDPEE